MVYYGGGDLLGRRNTHARAREILRLSFCGNCQLCGVVLYFSQFRCDYNLINLQFAIFRLPSHAFRNSFLIIPLCEHQAQVIHRSCRVLSDFRICCVCSKFLQHGLMFNVYIRKIKQLGQLDEPRSLLQQISTFQVQRASFKHFHEANNKEKICPNYLQVASSNQEYFPILELDLSLFLASAKLHLDDTKGQDVV